MEKTAPKKSWERLSEEQDRAWRPLIHSFFRRTPLTVVTERTCAANFQMEVRHEQEAGLPSGSQCSEGSRGSPTLKS